MNVMTRGFVTFYVLVANAYLGLDQGLLNEAYSTQKEKSMKTARHKGGY